MESKARQGRIRQDKAVSGDGEELWNAGRDQLTCVEGEGNYRGGCR